MTHAVRCLVYDQDLKFIAEILMHTVYTLWNVESDLLLNEFQLSAKFFFGINVVWAWRFNYSGTQIW